jgi:aminoglycoside phosphotransferase (APT) family kinase protein
MTEPSMISGIEALASSGGRISAIQISDLRRIRGGNSSEMWSFVGEWDEGGRRVTKSLILRSGMGNEFAWTGRDHEYRLLKSLEGSGVLCPRVYWSDSEGVHLGRPSLVMERCPGIADRQLLTDQNKLNLSLSQRKKLAASMIDILAAIHAAEVPEALAADAADVADAGDGSNPAERELRFCDEAVKRLEVEPMLELRLASWWLWRNLPPPPRRLTIVHGDYRPANMLALDDRITAILDWEFGHTGDPIEDLGWYLSRYYAAEHLIPGHWSYDDVVARYEHLTGIEVNRRRLDFWSVFAIYKLAYMTIAAIRWAAEGDPSRLTPSAGLIVRPLLKSIADLISSRDP